jgi:choline monooxygenase
MPFSMEPSRHRISVGEHEHDREPKGWNVSEIRWGVKEDLSGEVGTSRGTHANYTDPARLKLEREKVFRRTWHVAGRTEQIPNAHDFLVWERVGQSILIVCQEDGSLAAFHNVCRHRGSRLASESGHCEGGRFTCPFHGFVYDSTGDLVAVPERETFDAAALKGLRAAPVLVEVWGGWIWIHMDPELAEPLTRFLGPLADELSWYEMEDWKYYGDSTYVVDANWKVVLEGFLEAWHTETVHTSTVRGGFETRRATFASLAPHSMMIVPLSARDIDSAPKPVVHQEWADCQYLLFPTAFLNMFPDQGNLITVHPIDEHKTLCQGYVIGRKTAPKGVDYETWDKSVARSHGLMDRIMAEDLNISNEIAATKYSYANEGNLYSTYECRLTDFHRQLEKFLAD